MFTVTVPNLLQSGHHISFLISDTHFTYVHWCMWLYATMCWSWCRLASNTKRPVILHTDHYIYVESSSPAQSAQKANLLSKKFPATSGRCVSFWYHMFGPGTGDLTVYMKDGQTGALNELWTKSGDQGDKWLNGEISIKSDAEYQVKCSQIWRILHRRLCSIFLINWDKRPRGSRWSGTERRVD